MTIPARDYIAKLPLEEQEAIKEESRRLRFREALNRSLKLMEPYLIWHKARIKRHTMNDDLVRLIEKARREMRAPSSEEIREWAIEFAYWNGIASGIPVTREGIREAAEEYDRQKEEC